MGATEAIRKFPATLEPVGLKILYIQVESTQWKDGQERRCLDFANDELAEILGAEAELGGGSKFKNWGKLKPKGEYTFSKSAYVGILTAMVQAIVGNQSKPPATHGVLRDILKVAEGFSDKFQASLRNKAKLDEIDLDEGEDELEDLSDGPAPEPAKEETK